ncbi:MAG: carbohydrate ABC transporter permease [Paracoccus sp. (in: a-proteobacteria)]|uniref:carbohydrate ABC transporter permease n=1 Tax=Paracoccus sp. TaxID=267 RepID=UPI003919CEFD
MTHRFSTRQTLAHLLLILGAVIVLLPFYVMISTSFKSPAEIATSTGGMFGAQALVADQSCMNLGGAEADCLVRPVIDNYTQAFTKAPLWRYMLNGVIVTLSIFALQTLIAVPAAYALAKLKFWGREAAFGLVLFCLLIPVHAIALPLYLALARLGLTNSYAALIAPWIISAFGIFLMRQFFMTVPDDLIDAARMDGMGEFSIIWRVMLPAAIPALLAFAIFSVVAHWNDYFWPRIVITGDRSLFTPPLGLREFKGDLGDNFYGPMMATATIIAVPLVTAFLLAQRRFIDGITLSGMK